MLNSELNEQDVFAVEEALSIREKYDEDAEVVLVSAADAEADKSIRRCLAMGADRAIRIEGMTDNDPLFVAAALAEVIRTEQADIIFCGVQSSDFGAASTGTALAQFLNLPVATVVTSIEYQRASGTAIVERELEGGLVQVMEIDIPAVLTIQSGINFPRYANLRAVKNARKKPIDIVRCPDYIRPAHKIKRMFVPQKGGHAEMLTGSASDLAGKIKEIIEERLQ